MKPGLTVLKELYAIYQLDSNADVPAWADKSDFFSFTKTEEEVSIICKQNDKVAATNVIIAGNRKIFKIDGTLDLSLTGVIADISGILAKYQIPVFTVSTYNTDYTLVNEEHISRAAEVLQSIGYKVKFEKTANDT